MAKDRGDVMPYNLISGDNHIDLTYLPPDLWSSQAPGKWKLLVPRVEELEDGLHWFVDAQDKGMWNGVGPGFLKYQRGMFGHIDEMKDIGFEWDYRPGARPGRRSRVQAHVAAALSRRVVPALGGGRRVQVPDRVSLDRLQGAPGSRHAADGAAVPDPVASRALVALPARHDGSARVALGIGRLREISGLQFRTGRVGRNVAAVRVRPDGHRVPGSGAEPRLQPQAERLLPPSGLRDLPAGSISRADHSAHRRGQHHLGRGLPAPGLHLAELAQHTREEPERDLGAGAEEDHVRERGK